MSDTNILKMYENDIKFYKKQKQELQKEIDRIDELIQIKRQYSREIKGRVNNEVQEIKRGRN